MEVKQKAITVGVNLNNEPDFSALMTELKNLAEACEFEVVGEFEQNLKEINTAYYLGTGKVDELKELCDNMECEIVVFNNELSPSQLNNLSKKLERPIYDRTYLILEIFASRAKTKESKLQVEVAQLQYMLPRLVGANESLGRQGGGSGTRNRGAGEKKLELNRRKIEDKIAEINRELKEMISERQVQKKQREKSQIPTVALVGYTNAGKSTVMNAMIETYQQNSDKMVFEKDMLFATLETSVRNITLPNNKEFLLSDTVGFVSSLPHNLIKAFRSTLEEVKEADLLLHVVDFSNTDFKKQIEITNDTIKQIGGENIPMIYAFNKSDLTEMQIPLTVKEGVYISAKKRIGIKELTNFISKEIFTDYITCQMLIPYEKGFIVSFFNENAHIDNMEYEKEGTLLTLECKLKDYNKYKEYVTKVMV